MANAITAKETITVTAIINRFISDVTNRVMSGALYSGNNIRSPHGVWVVPPSYLGSIGSIPRPVPGVSNGRINANTLFSGLQSVTRYLLRVGTYSYHEVMSVTGSWPHGAPSSRAWSSSGKALFSDSYAASEIGNLATAPISPSIVQSPVISTHIITASDLIQLINQCYSSWSSSNRPVYSNSVTYCHASCHSNCHSSCHSSCDNSCNDACNCNADDGHSSPPCHNACYMNGYYSPCHSGFCWS